MTVSTTDFDWFNALFRIENLIHIEGMTRGDAYPEVFKEAFLDSLPEKTEAQIYQSCPVLAPLATSEEWLEPEEVAEDLALHRVTGFFVQAAQPVIRDFYPDGGYSYTWGYYHTEWLYAADADAISTVCAEWGAQMLAKDRAAKSEPTQ